MTTKSSVRQIQISTEDSFIGTRTRVDVIRSYPHKTTKYYPRYWSTTRMLDSMIRNGNYTVTTLIVPTAGITVFIQR